MQTDKSKQKNNRTGKAGNICQEKEKDKDKFWEALGSLNNTRER